MKLNTAIIKKTALKQRTWLWIIFGLSVLFLMSFLMWLALVGLQNGTHMNTYAADGTFQLYNPLRRLAAGQAIGYDFPFFHGIGIPFLHLPLFSLLGGGVFAAETTKWLISPLVFLLSSFVFFYAYFRDFKKSTIALALLTVMALSWIDVVWPGNSLIGIRGALPVLVGAALLWRTSRKVQIKHYSMPFNEVAALILLGLSLPFGTEQGVAAILAYALIGFVGIFRNQSETRLRSTAYLAIKGLIIAVIAFVTYAVLTKGHPLSAINYAFFDIPTDQGWYFGTDAQGFLTWDNLLPGLFPFNMRYMWATIILGCVSIYILLKKFKQKHLARPLWYACIYGIIAFVITITGYYAPSSQLISLQRMMGLIFIVLVISVTFSDRVWRWKPVSKTLRYIKLSVLILSIMTTIAVPLSATYIKITTIKNDFDIMSVLHLAREARHASDYFASSPSWKDSIDSFRPFIDPKKTIWSMYTSVYETSFGQHWNPSSEGEDYIIHAVGDERRATYESDFLTMKPDYVITLKPSYFDFEEWLWDNHWHIYEQLFTNYSLVAENNSHYLWKIRDTPQIAINPIHTAKTTPNTISLPKNDTKTPVVYSVLVNYKAHSAIPLTSRLPRYFIKVDTQYTAQRYRISLPSQKDTWTFPVILMPGEGATVLTASTDGIVLFSALTIESATYTQVQISSKNMKPIENNACFIQHKEGIPANYPWTCNPVTQELTFK